MEQTDLQKQNEQYRVLLESTVAIPWQVDPATSRFVYIGAQAQAIFGYGLKVFQSPTFRRDYVHPDDDWGQLFSATGAVLGNDKAVRFKTSDGRWLWMKNIPTPGTFIDLGEESSYIQGFLLDVSEHLQLERELRQAQKLESVGRLAAGVAHEINTPVQFVTDSITFASDSVRDLMTLIDHYSTLAECVKNGQPTADALAAIEQAADTADIDYVRENLPTSLERALEGLGRIASIVRAMKEFAHPDSKEKAPTDLNRAIETTLTIARNEYKYVADLSTDFATLPQVQCRVSEINQVVLNLVVNAAHAISDRMSETKERGRISVRTHADNTSAYIEIEDTGGGIPAAIADRVFDPFFTTKEVGRGTGQGLAIARSIVVEKHAGQLTFDCAQGVGTTFKICLPLG